jgi:replication factor C subunit 3/5|tara:strand:- start:477 stop:1415 length:939 start_codon:yes stop_codon:yes gene_type:complete
MKHENSPWVEKYRPTCFEDIVLDKNNKTILESILRTNYFPNLLLYGPPGTGKTTTIINLVGAFQRKHNQHNKGLVIHLNASDERGIDIIRNQINQFVHSKALFTNGTKLVILDEVDYMTKNAQQALKSLLRGIDGNVRFCLICNYITRIDESLQNEFMRLRFNQLPSNLIVEFLTKISNSENLSLSNDTILSIQQLYKSDIRSMINYMQSNQNVMSEHKVLDEKIWVTFTDILSADDYHKLGPVYLDTVSNDYNIEIKHLIKDYLNFIIRYKTDILTREFLKFAEFIMHLQEPNVEHMKLYSVIRLNALLTT